MGRWLLLAGCGNAAGISALRLVAVCLLVLEVFLAWWWKGCAHFMHNGFLGRRFSSALARLPSCLSLSLLAAACFLLFVFSRTFLRTCAKTCV
jgi:hypothetical protein